MSYSPMRLIYGKCLNCDNRMELEGPIHDDIKLCHACYDNENLIKYGFFIVEDLE